MMRWFRQKCRSKKSDQELCTKVIRRFGFRYKSEYGTYFLNSGGYYCLLWIEQNRVKLKVYFKGIPYAETEVIGPPFPSPQDLKLFIKSNI